MPFLYNVHAPTKTFALSHKDGESYDSLVSRIGAKAGLSDEDSKTVKDGKDGAGVVYEFEGGRWSLEDDDDLQILFDRLPPASTPSVTLHLTAPHPHARFAPQLPSYTAASALKDKEKNKQSPSSPSKVKSASKAKSTASEKTAANTTANASIGAGLPNGDSDKAKKPSKEKSKDSASGGAASGLAPSHHFPSGDHSGNTGGHAEAKEVPVLGKPLPGEKQQVIAHTEGNSGYTGGLGIQEGKGKRWLTPSTAGSVAGGKAESVRSTASRRSKYDIVKSDEPLGEVKKRAWHEFHNNTGVRTILGQVGDAKNVRMLLKPGYKGVYISRSFAIKNKLVNDKYSMGAAGYTGLKSIGLVSITVAGKTGKHQAMINEEMHFDVVLGRTWLEKMNIKVDPIDQTILTYMDNGAAIPVDIVVLKDSQGNKIHIT